MTDIERAMREYGEELAAQARKERFEMGVPRNPGNQGSPFTQAQATPGQPTPGAAPGLPGANRKPGMINLAHNLENVEQSSLLDVGSWPAKVDSVEEITASTGSQGIKFNLTFINFPGVATVNPNAGRKADHRVYVTPKALWKVKNSFCAVGQCDSLYAFDSDMARDVLVMVDVTAERYLPNGKADMEDNYVKTTKCDTLNAWPDDFGGPGTKFVPQGS